MAQKVPIPDIYKDLFATGEIDPLKEYAGITDVLPTDAATIIQAKSFVTTELSSLVMARLNRGLPAYKIIGVEAGRGRYITVERLERDGFPADKKARLMVHFDNGAALPAERLIEEELDGIGKNPNKNERSQSFEVHDLIRKYFSGTDGPSMVWAEVKAAVE